MMPVPSRPIMPKSYGVDAERTEGMLSWEEVEARLATARNYWLASSDRGGRPHTAPVWGLWEADALFFSTDPHSRKGANLAARPEVAIHLESGDDVVILEGRVDANIESDLRASLTDQYEAKYQFRPDFSDPSFGLFRFRPRLVLAWHEKDFPGSATRWQLAPGSQEG